VKAAFLKIYQNGEIHPLLSLLRRFTLDKDAKAGQDASRLLKSSAEQISNSVALESLKLVLGQKPSSLSSSQDDIIVELVRRSSDVRSHLAKEMIRSVTELFDDIYDRGDGATNCLDTIILDASVWPSEEERFNNEKDLFQLFIARLMESGHDHDGRAMKGITRLLATDAEKLKDLVDAESFDSILSALDVRESAEVRSQATLATAKYLEVSKESGEQLLEGFVVAKVKLQKNDELIVAVSAAAAIFPVAPAVMANLFLTEGFLPAFMPLLDRRSRSANVEYAVLEMLNAACVDKACREAILRYCSEWLSHMVNNGQENRDTKAAVILAKVRASGTVTPPDSKPKIREEGRTVNDLVDLFKGMMSKTTENNKQPPIEGLAFATIRPSVKEKLARDPNFMANFFTVLKANRSKPQIVFGGLTIIANMSSYLPTLSDEQKKMSQLKAYANSSKVPTPDPQDDDEHVAHRCNILVKAGVMSTLVDVSKDASSGAWNLICTILRSLSQKPKNRGLLAQQGAVKLLLSDTLQKVAPSGTPTHRVAAHALARILISVNPSHVFPASGFPQLTSAIRPLLTLLSFPETDSDDGPRDLLPTFESLLALTNLASSPNPTAADTIIRLAWLTLEELLLSANSMIQRASCELLNNLMTTPNGIVKFVDGTSRASQRLHILLALADVEDMPTRRAAGGALAMLTEYDAAASAVLDRARGVEILLDLCGDDEGELSHRGLVCVRNMTCATGDIGERARKALKAQGAPDILKAALRKSSSPALLEIGVEALKPLVE
jgi:protein unc-45